MKANNLHICVTAFLVVTFFYIFKYFTTPELGYILANILAFSVGITKEVIDKQAQKYTILKKIPFVTGTGFSKKDLFFDFFGLVTGTFVIITIDNILFIIEGVLWT